MKKRKPAEQCRTMNIGIRVTAREHEMIHRYANTVRRTVTDAIIESVQDQMKGLDDEHENSNALGERVEGGASTKA